MRAKKARKGYPMWIDDDDHDHFSDFNQRLSDDMEIRVATLTTGNRRVVLGKYGISPKTRRVRPMTAHLIAFAKDAEQCITREEVAMRKFKASQRRAKLKDRTEK